ncbi:MAG: hypothetical protein LBE62_03175 [Azonexus sp.]|jgi:prophage tail gpP-like protein|nr:hypothetical protein [Azonexus sp.]
MNASGQAELTVGQEIYGGWQQVTVTRSMEQCANGFELTVTERWPGQAANRPIRPGLRCTLTLAGETVISGYVDDVEPSYDKTAHSLAVRGRDATGDIVDCSAIHQGGQWVNATLLQIARDLCQPFGIAVLAETDVGAPFQSFNIEEGETAFECLERAARQRAVLLVSDARGGLAITRAGKDRAASALVEGENILDAKATLSWKDRYSQITVKGQSRATEYYDPEPAASASATATDSVINRYRPLIMLAEAHGANDTIKDRAAWEQAVRRGRGKRATVSVQGWTERPGALWRPNTLVSVTSPMLWLKEADMLIVGVNYTLDNNGARAALSLAAPEAFAQITGISGSRLAGALRAKAEREKNAGGSDCVCWGEM